MFILQKKCVPVEFTFAEVTTTQGKRQWSKWIKMRSELLVKAQEKTYFNFISELLKGPQNVIYATMFGGRTSLKQSMNFQKKEPPKESYAR